MRAQGTPCRTARGGRSSDPDGKKLGKFWKSSLVGRDDVTYTDGLGTPPARESEISGV
jgi:hypothetical protein